MIWNYFPVGMSYPVDDFSDEIKKQCWESTLSALVASEKENWIETELYDFCATNYPGSSEKEYVCILNQRHVTQTRVTVPMFKKMDVLRSQLSLHFPFYSANALDDFGPYIQLGYIDKDGAYSIAEEGKGVLPETLPAPMKKCTGDRVLIAMNAVLTPKGYSEHLRTVASNAAKRGMQIDYCPIASGSIGTAYAVTYAKEGRFEWLKGRKISSYLNRILLGILPGHTVIWDCAALNSISGQPDGTDLFDETVKAILDLGYRNIIFAADGYSDQGRVSSLLRDKEDIRLKDCNFTVLTSNSALINGDIVAKGNIFELIRMGASLCYAPDYVSEVLHLRERGRTADRILLEKDDVPGVTDSFQDIFDERKCKLISWPMEETEIDRLFE